MSLPSGDPVFDIASVDPFHGYLTLNTLNANLFIYKGVISIIIDLRKLKSNPEKMNPPGKSQKIAETGPGLIKAIPTPTKALSFHNFLSQHCQKFLTLKL